MKCYKATRTNPSFVKKFIPEKCNLVPILTEIQNYLNNKIVCINLLLNRKVKTNYTKFMVVKFEEGIPKGAHYGSRMAGHSIDIVMSLISFMQKTVFITCKICM